MDSLNAYLIAHISEISYFLSTMLMFLSGNVIMERLIPRLRRMPFLTRTSVFVVYGLVVLPGLTIAGALVLRIIVLEPVREWLTLTLVVSFLIVGVLLSINYNMKLRRRG